MLKACIFDLDGVVVDTAKFHFIAWRRLANNLGIKLTEEENEGLKGVPRMETLEIILSKNGLDKKFDLKTKKELAAQKNGWYKEYVNKMTPDDVLEGVRPFIEGLKEKGIKVALGSASKNAQAILKVTDMEKYFDVVIDGTKTTRSKPDPQVFQMGAEAVGVNPSEAVVFEDSHKGVDAALAGGFMAVGIGSAEVLGKAHTVVEGVKDVTFDSLVNLHSTLRLN